MSHRLLPHLLSTYLFRLVLFVTSLSAAFAAAKFTSFDPPGAVQTVPVGINSSGDVVGHFKDASNASHSFLRLANGVITTFDVATAAAFPVGINDTGQIAGTYGGPSGTIYGFLREPSGLITTIDLNTTGALAAETVPHGINASGTIVGAYYANNLATLGFLRTHDGTITTFQVPGGFDTVPTSINDAGDTTGYLDSPDGQLGFIRTADGQFQTFGLQGKRLWLDQPVALNDARTAVVYLQLFPCPGSDSAIRN